MLEFRRKLMGTETQFFFVNFIFNISGAMTRILVFMGRYYDTIVGTGTLNMVLRH